MSNDEGQSADQGAGLGMDRHAQSAAPRGRGSATLRMVLACLLIVALAGLIAGCGGSSTGESKQGAEPSAEQSAGGEESTGGEESGAAEVKKKVAELKKAAEAEAKKRREALSKEEAEAAAHPATTEKKKGSGKGKSSGKGKRSSGEKKSAGTKKSKKNGSTPASSAAEEAARKQFEKEEAAEVKAFKKLEQREGK
ncbi:MAG: hypothetical protein ABSB69_04140 [Solirubrobacteraceae bacterium]